MTSITIRVGLHLTYFADSPTTLIFLAQPPHLPEQQIGREQLVFTPNLPVQTYRDTNGNITRRLDVASGFIDVKHDAFIQVPSTPEWYDLYAMPPSTAEMTPELLRYTLPSRYCDSDKLMPFAQQTFGHIPHGLQRAQAICDWVHNHIEYRFGSGSPLIAASDTLANGYGICRDFAHLALALCRCFNMPARYVTGHLPDVAFLDSGSPMDFHAYFQVYAGGRWNNFDARFNVPRIGRIHIAYGTDAVECAFSTAYGAARLTGFQVWAYQMDPNVVQLGSPIDLGLRLDGVPELRFAPASFVSGY